MASLYNISMVNQTIIADSEMVIFRAATAFTSRASVLRIFRLQCSQTSSTTSAMLAVRWGMKASAFGTYTATTPSPLVLNAVASALTGSSSNAASSAGTDASANGAGTLTVLDQQAFNNLNGFEKIFTPEERPIVGPDLTFVFQLQGTPSALTGWSATVTIEEVT